MKNFIIIFVLLFIFSSKVAFSHGGRTDSSGCHNDNKTGMRHCHNRP